MKEKSLFETVALRLYPDTMTPLPSSRSKVQLSMTTPSVPCRNTAAKRSSAQSPAEGLDVAQRRMMSHGRQWMAGAGQQRPGMGMGTRPR